MQTVQLQRFVSGGGHSGTVWADPVDMQITGWQPVMSTEDPTTGQYRKLTRRYLYVRHLPDGPAPTSKDQILMDGRTWQVAGDPSDWNHGPYNHRPGWVVTVQYVAG